MSSEIIIGLLSLAGTLFGSLFGVIQASRLTVHRIEQLEKKMDKHNGLIERTVVLERDQKTLFNYKDNHETRIQKLEDAS